MSVLNDDGNNTPPSITIDRSSDSFNIKNNLNPTKAIHRNENNGDYGSKIHCLQYHKDTVLCIAKCQFLDNNKKLIEYIFSGSQLSIFIKFMKFEL